ncbi:hypothetical protein [Cellulomonas aerilata]|uniref:DUF937 domain-containing protein n=1 Tax=Cellulomonas aerilata TaxID=515326 RepID=A0A512D8B2_9CELL|nr:hypothetical protein [Cellulomonas aerilata]GEO32701.1 hypothetical protein CAE01nite_04260 [Cellulomonas aerilata]
MSMRRRIATAGVAGVLGVAGLAVVTAPLASAETTAEDGTGIGSRLEAIRDALAGLVTDGSITQEQADEVARTLDDSDALRGPGGHGHGHGGRGIALDAAAEALGMTADELRTALEVDGTTLADVAEAQGVDTQTLVDALVAAGTERITEEVTEGDLTQEEADERIAALPERIAGLVEEELPAGGHGRGPRGFGPRWGDPSGDSAGVAPDGSTADAAVFSGSTGATTV